MQIFVVVEMDLLGIWGKEVVRAMREEASFSSEEESAASLAVSSSFLVRLDFQKSEKNVDVRCTFNTWAEARLVTARRRRRDHMSMVLGAQPVFLFSFFLLLIPRR